MNPSIKKMGDGMYNPGAAERFWKWRGWAESGGAEQAKNHKCMVIFAFLYTLAEKSGGGLQPPSPPGSAAPGVERRSTEGGM